MQAWLLGNAEVGLGVTSRPMGSRYWLA